MSGTKARHNRKASSGTHRAKRHSVISLGILVLMALTISILMCATGWDENPAPRRLVVVDQRIRVVDRVITSLRNSSVSLSPVDIEKMRTVLKKIPAASWSQKKIVISQLQKQ